MENSTRVMRKEISSHTNLGPNDLLVEAKLKGWEAVVTHVITDVPLPNLCASVRLQQCT